MTQIEINKIPRLQKLQSTFKIKEMVKTANEGTAETLKDKDLNLTEMSNLSMQQQQLLQKSKWNRMLRIGNAESKNIPVG